jgi:hypothetical protein
MRGQSFIISDMVLSLKRLSKLLSSDSLFPDERAKVIDSATKICLMLMMGYPQEYFLPEERNFISGMVTKLNTYPNYYGENEKEY